MSRSACACIIISELKDISNKSASFSRACQVNMLLLHPVCFSLALLCHSSCQASSYLTENSFLREVHDICTQPSLMRLINVISLCSHNTLWDNRQTQTQIYKLLLSPDMNLLAQEGRNHKYTVRYSAAVPNCLSY